LDRSGRSIASIANIFHQDRVQGRARESGNGFRDTSTGRFDGDIIILFEVDASVLFRRIFGIAVELLLEAHITRSDDVLAIPPNTEAECFTWTRLVPGGTIAGWTFSPAIVATAPSKWRHISIRRSISKITSCTITATRERRRGPGVVPVAPERL
jgi:hypothetical protein